MAPNKVINDSDLCELIRWVKSQNVIHLKSRNLSNVSFLEYRYDYMNCLWVLYVYSNDNPIGVKISRYCEEDEIIECIISEKYNVCSYDELKEWQNWKTIK